MKSRLDHIETRLRALVENSLTWLPWHSRQPRLAEALSEAVRDQIAREAASKQPAANVIHIFMHPANATAWQAHPEWQAWLLEAMNDMANEAGVSFFAPPELSIKVDPALNNRELRLIAAYPAQEVSSTAVMQTSSPTEFLPNFAQNASAFLIIQGREVFPLNQPVVNIGRCYDNHIVLDDLCVSRNHAQIRFVRGNYTLFDLNSTGGTYINGHRIIQHTLTAGDVISFAGVTAIYGEEPATDQPDHSTSPAQIHPKESPDL